MFYFLINLLYFFFKVLQNEEEKNFTPLTTFPTLVSSKKSALVTKAPKRVSTLPPLQTSSHLRVLLKYYLINLFFTS